MAAAQGLNPQALSSLDSQIAEVEDMLSYISDILATGGYTRGGMHKVGVRES